MADNEYNALANIAQKPKPEMLGSGLAYRAAMLKQLEEDYQRHVMDSAENGVTPMDRETFMRSRLGG